MFQNQIKQNLTKVETTMVNQKSQSEENTVSKSSNVPICHRVHEDGYFTLGVKEYIHDDDFNDEAFEVF